MATRQPAHPPGEMYTPLVDPRFDPVYCDQWFHDQYTIEIYEPQHSDAWIQSDTWMTVAP